MRHNPQADIVWLNGFVPVIAMKSIFSLILAVLVVAFPHPVDALDCSKASQKVEKLLCATPELKKADAAMSAAYFKLLRETRDPDFREALIRSQRRWLEARAHDEFVFGETAEGDKTDGRPGLLDLTRDRMAFFRKAEPIRMMEKQREAAAKDSGGPFAGYESWCSVLSPRISNLRSWLYLCTGAAHRQHNARICSAKTQWTRNQQSEDRLVSVVKNGVVQPVASCSTSYGRTNEHCPLPYDDAEVKADAHWNTDLEQSKDLPVPRADRLWKYDPDGDPGLIDDPWMSDCLFASTYPPPESSRPSSGSRK